MGWMCTYTPIELIHASGFIPYRLYGIREFKNADGYFPINFCPYLKSSFEQLLSEGDQIKGAVLANSCDGARRLYDLTRTYIDKMPAYIMDVPRLASKDSQVFYKKSIEKLYAFLGSLQNRNIENDEILHSIKLYNRMKEAMRSLRKASAEQSLNFLHYYQAIRLSTITDPEIFCTEAELLAEKTTLWGKDQAGGPRIMVVGNFINEQKLFKILSQLDCQIVYDDLCTTQRYWDNKVDASQDCIQALAESYLGKPACMRMVDMEAKLRHLENIAQKEKISAILFVSLKFCDNTLYFYPLLKNHLQYPLLNLELEYNNFSEGQVKTRLEAFLEMLW